MIVLFLFIAALIIGVSIGTRSSWFWEILFSIEMKIIEKFGKVEEL